MPVNALKYGASSYKKRSDEISLSFLLTALAEIPREFKGFTLVLKLTISLFLNVIPNAERKPQKGARSNHLHHAALGI